MDQFVHPPQVRDPSLQPFSRDHYRGLVVGQDLIRSAAQPPAARRQALERFLQAWEEEIDPHFEAEERLLPPLMDAAQQRRLTEEHSVLRQEALEAARQVRHEEPKADFLSRLGRLLHQHIRWEERELFPAIQQTAGPQRLAELARATQVIEDARACRKVRPPSAPDDPAGA